MVLQFRFRTLLEIRNCDNGWHLLVTFVLPDRTEFCYTLSIWDLRSALLLEAC
jgi:hypothetical protein